MPSKISNYDYRHNRHIHSSAPLQMGRQYSSANPHVDRVPSQQYHPSVTYQRVISKSVSICLSFKILVAWCISPSVQSQSQKNHLDGNGKQINGIKTAKIAYFYWFATLFAWNDCCKYLIVVLKEWNSRCFMSLQKIASCEQRTGKTIEL